MRIWVAPLAAAAIAVAAADARALEAGASTFESGAQLYRQKPIRDQDIPVPPVTVAPAPQPPAMVPETGPGGAQLTFKISKFEVTGNTLLSPSRVDSVLTPYVGDNKKIADVQAARDALQKAYEQDGFLAVSVTIPQQTIESGEVHLEVIEARIGSVEVQNDGIHWFSDDYVRELTPSLYPGAILRREDLEADMTRANSNPDLSVRPVLKGGTEPGTVDVNLVVDDRIPLHGGVTVSNDRTPGSPDWRETTDLSYGNLWGLEHEISAFYTVSPANINDVQIVGGTYRAPMPWSRDQSLFYYVVYSKTANGLVTAPGLSALGNGVNMGLRYQISLPTFGAPPEFSHHLSFGLDRKDVTNTVVSSSSSIVTPITYLPFDLDWTGTWFGEIATASLRLGLSFNRTGLIPGDTTENFQENRGGVNPNNPVTGNYQIGSFSFEGALRLLPVLRTLAAGHFIDLPTPESSFSHDWTLNARARGQWASQPLISTEQYAAGGVDSVRGYLQSEVFGDDAWNIQVEIRAPTLENFFGGYLNERAQFCVFYDAAALYTLSTGPTSVPIPQQNLQGYGIGVRAGLFDHINGAFFIAIPRISDPYTTAGTTRYHLQFSAAF
jgi:hemolysin activation/secretion protein